MKLTVSMNSVQRFPILFSHHGVHLKRSLGGPPWWRYINGIVIRLPHMRLLWIEMWKPHRRGKLFQDRSVKRKARFT